jgi:hypothetical protein
MAETPRTEPITPQGIRRELSLCLDKKRLDSATSITVYVGPPPCERKPDEMRFFISRYGTHVGVFIPGVDAAEKAGKR